ncbi:MAG: aldo/keto reductase [Eubacteriales bacterium]
MEYMANSDRYNKMIYRRCGQSGLKLPAISLGMWHNFGDVTPFSNCREMMLGAFDLGITHFDLANNYGPTAGSAEESFGKVISGELRGYRDEIVVSTKAGYYMWPGPYGEWGSKKSLVSSLDQSLRRMKLDYVDIFYHHRPDAETPMEETADALAHLVRQGKALYIGISNYSPEQTARMIELLDSQGVHLLIHQLSHSMLGRQNEAVYDVLEQKGVGSIAFSPLAQGLLTDRYLNGIPEDSRAKGRSVFLTEASITPEKMRKVTALNDLAQGRGQALSQMALAWVLQRATSVIIGASRLQQIAENCKTIENTAFSKEELEKIEQILNG